MRGCPRVGIEGCPIFWVRQGERDRKTGKPGAAPEDLRQSTGPGRGRGCAPGTAWMAWAAVHSGLLQRRARADAGAGSRASRSQGRASHHG